MRRKPTSGWLADLMNLNFKRSPKMFRAVASMTFFALTTVSLMGGRLPADEPANQSSSQQEQSRVSFERRQFTVGRSKGKIYFDGTEAPRQLTENKSKELRLIEIFDGQHFDSDKSFHQWTILSV
jgi:hypothetical protein